MQIWRILRYKGNEKRIKNNDFGIIMYVLIKDTLTKEDVYTSPIGYDSVLGDGNKLKTRTYFGDLQLHEILFKGVNYLHLQVETKSSIEFEIEYSGTGHCIFIVMEGELNIIQENEENENHLTANEYFLHVVSKQFSITFAESSSLFIINLHNEIFSWIKYETGGTGLMTAAMKLILSDIMACGHIQPIKCLFIESKILSLLFTILAQFNHVNKEKEIVSFADEDIKKLEKAKKLIADNLGSPYTLVELAHEVGINDYKLKKGFKELFSTTVYGYRNALRMEYARKKLLSGNKVTDISDEVGFKNAHHFSVAFKKYYGISPSIFKKEYKTID